MRETIPGNKRGANCYNGLRIDFCDENLCMWPYSQVYVHCFNLERRKYTEIKRYTLEEEEEEEEEEDIPLALAGWLAIVRLLMDILDPHQNSIDSLM